MKRLVRKVISTCLYPFACYREKRHRHSHVRILTYHRISYQPTDRLAVSPSAFLKQMQYLRDAGYRVINLKDVYYHVIHREYPLDRLVAITFDDGYLDNYTQAFPILKRFNYEATIFLATGYISNMQDSTRNHMGSPVDAMLNWHEIKKMSRHGINFGAHTHTHCNLKYADHEEARNEILMPMEIIEDELNKPVEFFCYPGGMFNKTIQEIVKEAGYLGACSVIPGPNSRKTNLFELRRTEISGEDSLFDFRKKLSGVYDPLHRYIQRSNRRKELQQKNNHSRRNAKRKIRILHVIDSLVAEGAEQLLLDTLSEADRDNFEYVVACLASGGPLVDEIQNIGIPVCIIGRRHKVDLRSLSRLKNLIREFRPDVIHTHLFTSSFWGRIAAFIARKKSVVTEHNTSHWKCWYHRFANRILALFTSRIVAVSASVKDSLVADDKISEKRISVIKNGISLSRLTPKKSREKTRREFNCNDDDILAITVAALNEQKGYRYLIESAKQFVSKRPRIKIACVGDGPLRRELEERVASENLGENVIFTGSRRDIGDILDAADIYIQPSLYEGLSISLLEAAAMGKPIISTSLESSKEIINNGETGLLVATRDACDIAKAVEYCIDNKDKVSEMGERAAELVKSRFSVSKTTEQYESLYRELVNRE